MGLHYENLDAETRRLMVDELNVDLGAEHLYISSYLNEEGALRWPELLRGALSEGTDDALADWLRQGRSFKTHVQRRKPKGGFTTAAVPYTAPETLAGVHRFNLLEHIRALCLRAMQTGAAIVVYRAKDVGIPRPQTEAMIGSALDPPAVLEGLRQTLGVDPPAGIPLPNTGITVRLVPN